MELLYIVEYVDTHTLKYFFKICNSHLKKEL